jgi:hypothetical protein
MQNDRQFFINKQNTTFAGWPIDGIQITISSGLTRVVYFPRRGGNQRVLMGACRLYQLVALSDEICLCSSDDGFRIAAKNG